MIRSLILCLALLSLPPCVCADTAVRPAEWTKNLSMYQVNTRQFSKEGTFKQVEAALPRLQKMGVGIVYLMPIHPIGEKERKGTQGSPYAVEDYTAVNPEFGTKDDLRSLVRRAHELGMYVIIDWVGNHTAHDHPWTIEHPEFYHRNADGTFFSPPHWSDVLRLDYDHPGLRREMLRALRYWVTAFDIDGYRCDVADAVPLDFWEMARKDLDTIKPVFMLAEAAGPRFHRAAFDMTYSYACKDHLYELVHGRIPAASLHTLYLQERSDGYPASAYRMLYTSNHDENAWVGTVFERYGKAAELCMAFCCVFHGMPLVHNGQEAGLEKRLAFFEKDEIAWREHPFADVLSRLLNLKKRNPALWNGAYGGEIQRLGFTGSSYVYAFQREKDGHRVLAAFSFSPKPEKIELSSEVTGKWVDALTDESQDFAEGRVVSFPAWGYRVFEAVD